MRIEAIIRSNGLYSVRATETFENGEGADKSINVVVYSASQVYNFATKQISIEFATTEFMKPVPDDVMKKLTQVLEYVSKEI